MISDAFTKVYISCYFLAVSVGFLFSSYSGYKLSAAISYVTNDGWCDPSTQGIGDHCFGDFYYPLMLSSQDSPWSGGSGSPNPYPALALVIYKPFGFLAEQLGSRAALFLYLGAIIATVLLTVAIILKQNRFQVSDFFLVLVSTAASAPILTIIDRGNSAVLLLPILYLWMISVRKGKLNSILFLTCLAAIIRPQFILLALILLFLGEFKLFCKSIAYSCIYVFFSFFLFGVNPITNFANWVLQIVRYQDYGSVGDPYPVNISFANSFNLVLRVIQFESSEMVVKTLTYVLFIVFIFLFWRNRFILSTTAKINAVLIAPIFFIGTVFHYYLFIIGIIFINYLVEKNGEPYKRNLSFFNRTHQLTTRALFISVLVPWALPWSIFPGLDTSKAWPTIGIQWVFAQAIFMAFAILTFYVYPIVKITVNKQKSFAPGEL